MFTTEFFPHDRICKSKVSKTIHVYILRVLCMMPVLGVKIPCLKRNQLERNVLVVHITSYITLLCTTYVITICLRLTVVQGVTTDMSRRLGY